jgi:hypothetical protein
VVVDDGIAVSPAGKQGPHNASGDPLSVLGLSNAWRVCERAHAAIVGDLDMPVPFDLGQFVAGLERERHRPIRLRPFSSGAGVPCGLWIGTADADYIYHETGTTPFHATHIVLHELAHMLLGHHQHTAAGDRLISLLAPDVDQALIQLILGRSTYGTAEEREAETLASLIFSCAAVC